MYFNTLIANPSCVALALDSGIEFESNEQDEWHDKWHRKTIHYGIDYNNECKLIPKKLMKRAVKFSHDHMGSGDTN